MNRPHPFQSVFDTVFDAAVYGCGYIGFSAARRLAARGWKVLLFDASADLLWESGRALENRAGGGSAQWREWLESLKAKGGADERHLEPALAEVMAAEMLRRSPSIRTLLYAAPVGVRTEGGAVTGVSVATKSGLRSLRARRWVDASEEGVVARLAGVDFVSREPEGRFESLVIQTRQPGIFSGAIARLSGEMECAEGFRGEERRLRWEAGREPSHRKVASLVKELREQAAGSCEVLVSHLSLCAYPVYAACQRAESPATNLCLLAPALRGEAIVSLADRFDLGWNGVEGLLSQPGAAPSMEPVAPSAPVSELCADVVVAGAGTAGAVAAISAARSGARTIAVDFTPRPGGVGAGGLISGYFHGAPGGLQEEIDLRTQAMSTLMTGKALAPSRWHHAAKPVVLLEMFEEASLEFIGNALLFGVERDETGRVAAVMAAVAGRILRLSAAAFIDATGDGDLCALAGATFIDGRPGDGRSLSYSQSALALIPSEEGFSLRSYNFDAGWVDPADTEDLTRARLEGLAQYAAIEWRRREPIVAMASLLGLRQSRQIVTDYCVTLDDMVSHARFADSLGNAATVADSHSVDFEFESDDMAFYFWSCRAFRHRIDCELPYRMLLPAGLGNVWIACRAAGISYDAANGLRMQREMQRLGEAAGIAAAMAANSGCDSRSIDLKALLAALDRSGARGPARHEEALPAAEVLYAALDEGAPGIYLWHLYRQWESHRDAVLLRLEAPNPRVSFYAAAAAAMAGEAAGEPRLLRALRERETGPAPEQPRVPGAYGQEIDVPFWLQALVLLRRGGSGESLASVRELITAPGQPFNVVTMAALTLERLAQRLGPLPALIAALEDLAALEPGDSAVLPPSRSLWRELHGEPQLRLANDRGTDTRQDHAWQLRLIMARTRKALGLAPHPVSETFRADPRGFVRKQF